MAGIQILAPTVDEVERSREGKTKVRRKGKKKVVSRRSNGGARYAELGRTLLQKHVGGELESDVENVGSVENGQLAISTEHQEEDVTYAVTATRYW